MGLLRHYNRWHNGEKRQEDQHEYVDLDLPSGLLWAKYNIGADTEVDAGGYYAWGETEEKENCTQSNYSKELINKYFRIDDDISLNQEDDVAHVNWGGKWRMPTEIDFEELFKNTNAKWVENYNDSEINGVLFTSIRNKNTLFFPSCGYMSTKLIISEYEIFYWTANKEGHGSTSYYACEDAGYLNNDFFHFGFNIKAVREK